MNEIDIKPEENKLKSKQDIVKSEVKKPGVGGRAKKLGCILIIIIAILAICIGGGVFLWAGGYVKDTTCSTVKKDSYIWERSGCAESSSSSETSISSNTYSQENTISIDTSNIENVEDLVTKVIEGSEKAVVSVTIKQVEFDDNNRVVNKDTGIGTAFVVQSNGLLVTNQHVVSDVDAEYGVVIPGSTEVVPVKNIYRDNINDIAILKIDKNDLETLPLGNSDEVKRGNLVIAIGNALGRYEGTSTVGFVSGLGRNITAGGGFGTSTTYYEDVIQTDAAINPGNSGGPLINSKGNVIGVNFATTQGAENISFAIPINRVKDKLVEFETYGKLLQPYIGIAYEQRPVFLKDGVLNGAVITGVEKDGPAAKGGMKVGDIILSINDFSMEDNSLFSVIQKSKVGDDLKINIWRNGEKIDLTVKVGDKGE